MPVYEFTCKSCGADCEILVRSAAARPICPSCGGKRLEKKFSVFATRGTRGGKASCTTCTSSACSTCRR